MLDLIALALLSLALLILFPSPVIAFIAGLLVAILLGGIMSFLSLIPAAILSLAPSLAYALKFDFQITTALATGISLFLGYVVGSILNVLFFPLRVLIRILRKIF
mgnify:CR=1 FL=1